MREKLMTADQRAVAFGEYIVEHNATVRKAALAMGASKSTVHKEVTHRLREIDYGLYSMVRQVIETNKSERHIRGGNATREKYRRIAMSGGRSGENR